jgi:hypothetical protein
MAATAHSDQSASWLASTVAKLRGISMSDWLKLALTIAGTAILMWTMVQQHEFRIEKLEHSLDQHFLKHDEQYNKIQQTLLDIQLKLGRLTDK